MFIAKNSLLRIASLFAIVFLTASCWRWSEDLNNIVGQYYSAIENGDADTAASLFAEQGVVVTTPSGNVLTGRDAVESNFIPYDLQNMDHVEFLSDFTENNGKLSVKPGIS